MSQKMKKQIKADETPGDAGEEEPEQRISIPDDWEPISRLGRRVMRGEVTSFDQILDSDELILEQEITDSLLPNLEVDLINIGQSKGKFGGGRRRAFRQTQKKTQEGNKPKFAAYCIVGDRNGIVGMGYGKAREVVPAREKAVRNAKKNVFRVQRGSGSWETTLPDVNSIPFKVIGKAGSVTVELTPAPKGTGIVAEKELAKILALAGIQDVWAKIRGHTVSKINVVLACERALRKLSTTKVKDRYRARLGMEA